MSPLETLRYAALTVGGIQLLANLVALVRGPARIRRELESGAVSERFADLLSVAWIYGSTSNLCIPILLLLLAGPLGAGSPVAGWATAVIGSYYVTVGLATYFLGIRRHSALLVFVLLGLLLLIPLWVARQEFVP